MSAPEEELKSVSNMTRHLRNGIITFDEWASNVILSMVGKDPQAISKSLSQLSAEERESLVDYAVDYFAENNFMPHPIAFMADTRDPADVERKREEMRPKYEQLMEILNAAVGRGLP